MVSISQFFRWTILLSLFLFMAACTSTRSARPRYSAAPQQLATYHAPGTSGDPWGPYIQEAATRFQIPAKWIREVMRRESGGEQYQAGSLTTSSVGAMGLMQIMPGTYLTLQKHYSLGIDPYNPHDNIMAGAAYIRQMYDRFGSPGFLAAYNAGPERLNQYLYADTPLPAETVAYVTAIAPRLGTSVRATGPLAAYASATPETSADELNERVAGGSFQPAPYQGASANTPSPAVVAQADEVPNDGSADDLNAQILSKLGATQPTPPSNDAADQPGDTLTHELPLPPNNWAIQVGAFSSESSAETAIQHAKSLAGGVLDNALTALSRTTRGDGVVLYRAKLAGLSANKASAACERLIAVQQPCIVVPLTAQS